MPSRRKCGSDERRFGRLPGDGTPEYVKTKKSAEREGFDPDSDPLPDQQVTDSEENPVSQIGHRNGHWTMSCTPVNRLDPIVCSHVGEIHTCAVQFARTTSTALSENLLVTA